MNIKETESTSEIVTEPDTVINSSQMSPKNEKINFFAAP
jgi:hypothetical protein